MSQFDQGHQVPVAYPPPSTSYPPRAAAGYNGPYVMAPPPIGYPTKDGDSQWDGYNGPYVMAPPPIGYPTKDGDSQWHVPIETTSRGDGFWKGCVAALCCCCCLDICFC